MIKSIDIGGGREITLCNDSTWFLEYSDQFGTDILPTIMPIISTITKSIGALAEEIGGLDGISEKDLYRLLNSDELLELSVILSTMNFTDFQRITWSMARAYDPNISEPKKWLRELGGEEREEVPWVDVVIPQVAILGIKSVLTSKNFERLTANVKMLQPKKKKKSK